MVKTIPLSVMILAWGATFFCSSLFASSLNQIGREKSKTQFDRVVIQQPNSSSRIALRGTIINYTGSSILIKSAVGTSVKEYPTSSVVRVSTSHVISYLQGMKFYTQKNFSGAVDSFEKAIELEDRKWVRREILAMLVRCALQAGDYQMASSRFLMLTESDAETFHFHLIPLQWTPSSSEKISQLDGLVWMQSKSAITRLLGASRLLLDEKYGHFAATEMKKLATDADRRIHYFANMQLWRLELQQPKNLTKYQLEQWQKKIERTPSNYRAGGWYLLGLAHAHRHEYEQSATALLWLPLVYDQDKFLAARSCYEGAESLLQIGKKREAETLLQEVVKRFNKTPAAQQAAITLQKLQR